MEDAAAYAENLSLKDEVVQSLSSKLADLQSTSSQHLSTASSPTSPSQTLVDTSCHLERLTVFHETSFTVSHETCTGFTVSHETCTSYCIFGAV